MFKDLSVLFVHLSKTAHPSGRAGKRRFVFPISMVICGLILFIPNARSQTIKGTYSFDRNPAHIKNLLSLLKTDGQAAEVLKCFFGENILYDERLPDLLVFIDKTERDEDYRRYYASEPESQIEDKSAHIALLKNGKRREKLFGQKYIYVMVFIAEKHGATPSIEDRIAEEEISKKKIAKVNAQGQREEIDETTTTTKIIEPISVSQSSLAYTQGSGEFVLSTAFRAIASVFSGATVDKAEKSEKAQDIKNLPVKMWRVGYYEDIALFFGYAKLPVYDNTINRLTINEDYADKYFRHQATFGNYSPSVITTSIGVMGTFLEKRKEGEDKRVPANAYLFGHVYIKRPQLPSAHFQEKKKLDRLYEKSSLSIVAGTRISKSLFDDLFIGLCAGHLLSTTGIVLGASFRTPTDSEGKITGEKRRLGLCAGLTFIF